ncbi:unnamed protein product, partial [Mesorhabditis belari]|uniref:Uncharacterized protein n=1 Tax=Mesorhabditis belari TaxID=2138241 RepID=A0AAF3FB19_9BILA
MTSLELNQFQLFALAVLSSPMLSSPMMLSFTTIFSLLGVVLMIVGLSFDNWIEYQVDRKGIIKKFTTDQDLNIRLKDAFVGNKLYYSRNYGLFNVCFGETMPNGINSYNKLGVNCINYNDYLPSDAELSTYTQPQNVRLWLMRGLVCSFALGMILLFISFAVGITACWTRSQRYVRSTAYIMLFSMLFVYIGLGLWHYVDFIERNQLDMMPFYRAWETTLKNYTQISYGWTLVLAWIGAGFLTLATVCMFLSAWALKREDNKAFEAKHGGYALSSYYPDMKTGTIMPSYNYNTYGYGQQYPGYYPQYNNNQYYGYMTYGR